MTETEPERFADPRARAPRRPARVETPRGGTVEGAGHGAAGAGAGR